MSDNLLEQFVWRWTQNNLKHCYNYAISSAGHVLKGMMIDNLVENRKFCPKSKFKSKMEILEDMIIFKTHLFPNIKIYIVVKHLWKIIMHKVL